MKKEIEIKWIVNLLSDSSVKNNFFFKRGTSKSGFERIAEAPTKSKEFKKWFEERKIEGIFLEYEGVYLLDKSKLIKYFKEFYFWGKIKKIVIKEIGDDF